MGSLCAGMRTLVLARQPLSASRATLRGPSVATRIREKTDSLVFSSTHKFTLPFVVAR